MLRRCCRDCLLCLAMISVDGVSVILSAITKRWTNHKNDFYPECTITEELSSRAKMVRGDISMSTGACLATRALWRLVAYRNNAEDFASWNEENECRYIVANWINVQSKIEGDWLKRAQSVVIWKTGRPWKMSVLVSLYEIVLCKNTG